MSFEVIDSEGNIHTVESEIDTKTGVDLARQGLREKGLKTGVIMNHKETNQQAFVPDEDIKEAYSTGKFELPVVTKARQKAMTPSPVGKVEAFARGAANPMTFGYADEISALVNSLIDGGDYEQLRNEYRTKNEQAWKEQPVSYGAGTATGILAPVATGFLAAPSSIPSTLGTAMKEGSKVGAIGAGGTAEELKDLPIDVPIGAITGAGFGAAGYAGGKLIGKGIDTYKSIKDKGIKNTAAEVAEGVKESVENLKETGKIIAEEVKKGAEKSTLGSITGVLEGIKKASNDITFRSNLSKELTKSSGVNTSKLSNAEFKQLMFEELSKPGNTTFKTWLSEEISKQKGKPNPDMLESFNLGSEARNTARGWTPEAQKEEARVISKALQSSLDETAAARNERFLELEKQAAKEYKDIGINALEALETRARSILTTREGQKALLSPSDQAKVTEVLDILKQGANIKGADQLGLNKSGWYKASAKEQYKRLVEARKIFDKRAKVFSREGNDIQSRIMRNFRGDIDDILKQLESKAQSDKLWSETGSALQQAGSKIGINKTRHGEVPDVDYLKVRRGFHGTDEGERTQEALYNLQDTLDSLGIGDEAARAEVINSFKNAVTKSKNSTVLNRFEKDGSPSGLAIERLINTNKRNFVDEVINSPANILRMIDENVRLKGRTWTADELKDVSKWKGIIEAIGRAKDADVKRKAAEAFADSDIATKIINGK